MRLHRLAVTAFGPFGAVQEVDFDALSGAGIFLLHGPTGAGKTSVLDAVCFALYGAVPGARQSPGASLRSDHAEAGVFTEVLLELTVGGRRLEITRRPAQTRPKKNGKGFTTDRAQSWLRAYDAAEGTWRALSRSHQEIGEEIAQLVGMSRDQFCQVVLLPQGDFARFLRADAEARGKLLGRLFDTRRYAAVEERLAERRRAAEAQVHAGDERLLALAQRMEQAAGPAAEDWPLPGRQAEGPGAYGLADAVLGWAAVARAGARERREIAEGALLAAESRQAAARRELDAERELDRLQHRYADAARRARVLEERRAGHEAGLARLERARRAERVAPALALRDDADRGHRVATAAHERLRDRLPPALADAGAEQLAERERRLRQDLGALESALRAERRSTEITRERAELDRQARADDDTLHEAEGWLAGWDELRREHRAGVAEAQEAATRAEHLAGLLEPARRRLRAARDRDRLTTEAATADELLRAARDRAGEARETWLDLKERRLRGIAAELAASLTPGAPCAVCGSPEHPAPARTGDGHVAPAREKAAYEAYTRLDTARSAAERERAVVGEALATARLQARDGEPAGGRGGDARSGESAPGSGTEIAGVGGETIEAGDGIAGSGGRPAGTGEGTSGSGAGSAGAGDGIGGSGDGIVGTGEGTDRCGQEGFGDGAGMTGSGGDTAGPGRGSVDSGALDTPVAELESLVARLEDEHRRARRLASGAHAAREAHDRAEREHAERLAVRQEVERRGAARTSRREALDQEQAALTRELARVHEGADDGSAVRDGRAEGPRGSEGLPGDAGDGAVRLGGAPSGGHDRDGGRAGDGAGRNGDAPGSVAELAALLERRVRVLGEAARAAREADLAAQRLKEADARLADAAFAAGFDTPYAAADALLDDPGRRELEHRADRWRTEAAAVADRLAEPDARVAAARQAAAPEAALAAQGRADRALREAASADDAARERCAELDRLSRLAGTEVLSMGPLREEHERVARLAALTAGTAADNERRMRLESYVLAARLEQVAAAASLRLQRMSSGRYTLVHSDARSGGRRSGLGLHVVDAWTGSERDTATLSGGETFFASLALALGLADVVTEEAGGVRLDTLFIDEGFGSLDEQTLDEVIDVLDTLRERDRSVGIVSHVADLRQRIPTQLEVVKERHGSTVRLRTAPLDG